MSESERHCDISEGFRERIIWTSLDGLEFFSPGEDAGAIIADRLAATRAQVIALVPGGYSTAQIFRAAVGHPGDIVTVLRELRRRGLIPKR